MLQIVTCMIHGCAHPAQGDLLLDEGAKLPLCDAHGRGQQGYERYKAKPKRTAADEISWPANGVISVQIMRREDGGVRIWSADVPGLNLSGPDGEVVMGDLYRALSVLTTYPGPIQPPEEGK